MTVQTLMTIVPLSAKKLEDFSATSKSTVVTLTTTNTNDDLTSKSNNSNNSTNTSLLLPMKNNTNMNRLDRDGVNISFDNVDMSMLSTVHVCAAQVRR